MRVCQFRHFGTGENGAFNATLTLHGQNIFTGYKPNCNTTAVAASTSPGRGLLSLSPRVVCTGWGPADGLLVWYLLPCSFCEKSDLRAIVKLTTSVEEPAPAPRSVRGD